MIKKYSDEAAYTAAGVPTDESRIAQIESTNDIKVDGVNVQVDVPQPGDAVYYDEEEAVFFKGGDQLNPAKLPNNIRDNKIGVVTDIVGDYAVVLNKDTTSLKYCDVLQYQLNAPTLDGTEHTQSIGLWLSNTSYASATTISFTYSATTLSAVVAALNTAIDAKKEEVSFNQVVWAYMADADNNKVTDDADATKIIVQIDTWNDYRQYQVQGGTFITWGDMPVNNNSGYRVNSKTGGSKIMSVSRAAIYFSTNGRTPTAMVQPNENEQIITLAAFNGEYGRVLRNTYSSYEKYIAAEYSIMHPQKLGVFNLPDGKTLTQKYGNMTAPTRDGNTKYKFPAMHYTLTVGYNVKNLKVGDWYLPGVDEGTVFMEDTRRNILNKTAAKMNISQISNSSLRWFSQRSSVSYAWIFGGSNGTLSTNFVCNSGLVQGVALLKIKH